MGRRAVEQQEGGGRRKEGGGRREEGERTPLLLPLLLLLWSAAATAAAVAGPRRRLERLACTCAKERKGWEEKRGRTGKGSCRCRRRVAAVKAAPTSRRRRADAAPPRPIAAASRHGAETPPREMPLPSLIDGSTCPCQNQKNEDTPRCGGIRTSAVSTQLSA